MSWIDKLLPPSIKRTHRKNRRDFPEGVWVKCPSCEATLYRNDVANNLQVCPKCDHHMPIRGRERLDKLLDKEGRREIGREILPVDSLHFEDLRKYTDRLTQARTETSETDALVVMSGTLESIPVVVACFDFSFMAGSMGSVVGERFVRGALAALEQRIPFICVTTSGGARMQENVLSLLQMAKTTAILTKLSDARLPFISVLTSPTTGGVSASFAFLGDVVIAEPKAVIAFTGARIIQQVVHEVLPPEYQRSEFLLKRGAIDMIVDRRSLGKELARLITLLTPSTSVLAA